MLSLTEILNRLDQTAIINKYVSTYLQEEL